MARKKHQEEHENHERWLVSYADFITLLFAFFVVMYSLSSVNEGKYRVLAEALQAAFRAPTKSLQPIQVGQLARVPLEVPPALLKRPIAVDMEILYQSSSERGGPTRGGGGSARGPSDGDIQRIAREIEQALERLIEAGLVTVRASTLGVEVAINTSLLFPSGSSQLTPPATPVIKDLARILKPFPNRIRVKGYTDNVPISTPAFPSNWELSAARAATVVRLFAGYGVGPRRMAAIGLGEYHPVANNASVAGRRKNRRVVLSVLAETGGAGGAERPRGTDPGSASPLETRLGDNVAQSEAASAAR